MRYWSLLAAFLLVATAIETGAADLPLYPRLLANRVSIGSGDGTEISGFLYRPQTDDPRPAVLILHGCSGLLTKKSGRLKSRETAWRDIFLAEGYVVLLLDSFTERGHRSICKISIRKRPIEPHRERPHDAYGALRWLQAQPFVIPSKVALGGWSNGAMSMLWTVDAAAPQRPANLTHDFRAAFGFYPGCITLKKRRPDYTAAVPTFLQLGADDDWTWPKPCQDLAERAGISRTTLYSIEKGAPGPEIGTVFELAAIVGVQLFEPDSRTLAVQDKRLSEKLALLPQSVRRPKREVDDDF